MRIRPLLKQTPPTSDRVFIFPPGYHPCSWEYERMALDTTKLVMIFLYIVILVLAGDTFLSWKGLIAVLLAILFLGFWLMVILTRIPGWVLDTRLANVDPSLNEPERLTLVSAELDAECLAHEALCEWRTRALLPVLREAAIEVRRRRESAQAESAPHEE